MLEKIFRNKYLVKKLIIRDIKNKYKGSVLGMVWQWIVPIMMLGVYTFVFSEVFQARWNANVNDKYQFAMTMFCGLSVFNVLAEVMNRSSALIRQNQNYVKKVVFPLELLPFVVVVSSLFNCLINLLILAGAKLVIYRTVSLRLILLVPALIPVFYIALGVCLFLSALSVYLRDVGSVITVIVAVLMYATPVFYSSSAVPDKYRLFNRLNPLTYMIENVRSIILYDEPINMSDYMVSLLVAIALYFLGLSIFKRSKEGFADVI